MNPLVLQARKWRRTLKDLSGYLHFDRKGNEIVRRTDFTACPQPVLLIYGFLSTRRSFEILERRLRRDGYCVFSINLGGMFDAFNTRGIDESAEKVRVKIERLYARYNLGPLSIIGHSKGGLIGLYYVKRLGGEKRVVNLITLGTPHHGTRSAYFGIATMGAFAPSVWQMTPRAKFIRKLESGAFPSNVRFTSIYSKADMTSPPSTAKLDAAGGENVRNIEIQDIAHNEFLVKSGVYQIVRRELKLGHGEQPSSTRLRSIVSFNP